MTDSQTRPIKLSQRVPWLSITGVVLVTLMTLANAAINMMPSHVPTARERQRAEQNAMIEARRERIATLFAEGDHCRPQIARELARALVFDGQSAADYADDYELRCGDDPIVRRWAIASGKLRFVRIARAGRH